MNARMIKTVTVVLACLGIGVSAFSLSDVIALRVAHNRLMNPDEFEKRILSQPMPSHDSVPRTTALENYTALHRTSDRATLQSKYFVACGIIFGVVLVGVALLPTDNGAKRNVA